MKRACGYGMWFTERAVVGPATRGSFEHAAPALKALALPKKLSSLGAWAWARAGISSRTVFVPFDAAGALCPVGDLFNYAPPPPPHHPPVGPGADYAIPVV